MESWLESLSTLRNKCAHHSVSIRQKIILNQPRKPETRRLKTTLNSLSGSIPELAKWSPDLIYTRLRITYIFLSQIDSNTDWAINLRDLIEKYENEMQNPNFAKEYLGFPEHWKQDPLLGFSSSQAALRNLICFLKQL